MGWPREKCVDASRCTGAYFSLIVPAEIACGTLCAGYSLPSAPPALHGGFMMSMMCRTWLDKEPIPCTVAYTGEHKELGHRLYVLCRPLGVETTKLYDFDKDILYELKGDTRMWNVTVGIPESEKYDPIFPVEYRMKAGRKVYDANSLTRLQSENMVFYTSVKAKVLALRLRSLCSDFVLKRHRHLKPNTDISVA